MSITKRQTLDPVSFALSNTLGALFSLIGLANICAIGLSLYLSTSRKTGSKWLLTDTVLVFMALFIIIRAVYFIIIPRTIAGSATDYVLSSIPTFLYFTSFSLILAFWVATVRRQMAKDSKVLVRYGTIIVIVTNVILYSFFVVLVVTYSQIVETSSQTSCGRRTEISLVKGQETQKAIAIAYAAVVAGVSLIFGIGFLYFGRAILTRMGASDGGRSTMKKRMTIMTIIFSVTFLLHSPFILVVAAISEKPIAIFSFLGLVFTEILPVAFFLAVSNRLRAVYRSSSSSGTSRTSKNSMAKSPSYRMRTHSGNTQPQQVDISAEEKIPDII